MNGPLKKKYLFFFFFFLILVVGAILPGTFTTIKKHRFTTAPIYVGQTSRSLKKRDYEHRRQDKTPFDRDLKGKYRTAHIVLIAEKRCANTREGKDWMDWIEGLSLKRYKCLIGKTPHGNRYRTRHYKDVDKFANDVREKREFLGEVGKC